MKKTLLFIALNCLLGSVGLAQTRARVFDNFDTANGIQVIAPPKPIVAPLNNSKNKKLVKKTAQVKGSVEDGMSLKDNRLTSNLSFNKLSMSAGKSLGG